MPRYAPAALLALAGGALAYTTHPAVARISAFVDTIDKAPAHQRLEDEPACPRCGTSKEGAVNCCSGDGAWAGKCTESITEGGEHTWTEGFAACRDSSQAMNRSEFEASAGGIHEYPGELSAPLRKAEQAIAAGLSGSYDSVVAGTEAEGECRDDNMEQCPLWAQKGECEGNAAYMRASCKLSCGACYAVSARRKANPSPSPSPSPASSPLAVPSPKKAAAVSTSPSPLSATAQAKVQAKVADTEKRAQQKAQEEAHTSVGKYNKTAPEAAPVTPQSDPKHGDVKHANEYVLAERSKLVREQAIRDAAATADKVKAESLMSQGDKDALDRKEYQAAIATALASAKTATRDPGDRMEVWEEAINKAIDKKSTGSIEKAKDTLVPGQLRPATKEETSQSGDSKGAAALAVRPFETKTAQFEAFARSSPDAGKQPSSESSVPASEAASPAVTETKAAPSDTKAAPFAAFATAHAAAREICKGKQGECA